MCALLSALESMMEHVTRQRGHRHLASCASSVLMWVEVCVLECGVSVDLFATSHLGPHVGCLSTDLPRMTCMLQGGSVIG